MAGVRALRVGDPADPRTDVVRIGNPRTARRSMYQYEEALRKGGTLLTGGVAEDQTILPTVIEFGAEQVLGRALEEKPLLWVDEAFAPLRSLVVFEGDDQCLALANDSAYGLAGSIFAPEDRAVAIARRLDAAQVAVNESPLFADPHLPVGGIKDSGLRGSPHKVHELTYVKRIHVGAE